MISYKILIEEDDPVIQSQLRILLAGNGYTAVAADLNTPVADTVRARNPHLILLDISLPREEGFSVCSRIRAFSDVPIIFVTGKPGSTIPTFLDMAGTWETLHTSGHASQNDIRLMIEKTKPAMVIPIHTKNPIC